MIPYPSQPNYNLCLIFCFVCLSSLSDLFCVSPVWSCVSSILVCCVFSVSVCALSGQVWSTDSELKKVKNHGISPRILNKNVLNCDQMTKFLLPPHAANATFSSSVNALPGIFGLLASCWVHCTVSNLYC